MHEPKLERPIIQYTRMLQLTFPLSNRQMNGQTCASVSNKLCLVTERLVLHGRDD